jgi:hypothetical protein
MFLIQMKVIGDDIQIIKESLLVKLPAQTTDEDHINDIDAGRVWTDTAWVKESDTKEVAQTVFSHVVKAYPDSTYRLIEI